MYHLGKRSVGGILGLNGDIAQDTNHYVSILFGDWKRPLVYVTTLAQLGGLAACARPPPAHEGTISRHYVKKDVKLPGRYLDSGRSDAWVFDDCSNGVGCTTHEFYGLPEAVRTLRGRAQMGDGVSWPQGGNTVNDVSLVRPSPLGEIPYGLDLDVRESVLDRLEDLTTFNINEPKVTLKAVYVIRGFVQGAPRDIEKYHFLNVTELDLNRALDIRNSLTQHRTVRIREPTGSGSRAVRRPGTITGEGADQDFDVVIDVPYPLIEFVHREKTEVKGKRMDVRGGAIDEKGVHIYGKTEAPCISHPGYIAACEPEKPKPAPQPAKPTKLAAVKPAPKPAPKPSAGCDECSMLERIYNSLTARR